LSAVQVAFSLILLSAAGLLLRSLWNLQNVPSGVDARGVIGVDIALEPANYPNSQTRQQFFNQLAARLRALPLVKSVAISDSLPPAGFIHNQPLANLRAPGMPAPEQDSGRVAVSRFVSADYFRTLGIPILRGRAFVDPDMTSSENVMILSASLARYLFASEEPVGRTIAFSQGGGKLSPGYTVVGVAADVKNNGLAAPADAEYYLPRKEITDPNKGRAVSLVARAFHVYDGEAFVTGRSAARADTVEALIRTLVAALDPTVPATIAPLEQRLRQDSALPRFSAALLVLFAVTGMMLAAAGVYGLVSFLVARRTQEVGVRMALGATSAQVVRMILGHSLRWSALGVVVGVAGSIATGHLLQSLLFQVTSGDSVLIGVAALLFLLLAAVAALRPSLLAARIDPMAALRQE
jgi:predicted permease